MAKAGGGDAGYKALATIVMRAYYSRKPEGSYVRLRRVIQKFLFGIAEDTGDPILDAVATAWTEHFTPPPRSEIPRRQTLPPVLIGGAASTAKVARPR